MNYVIGCNDYLYTWCTTINSLLLDQGIIKYLGSIINCKLQTQTTMVNSEDKSSKGSDKEFKCQPKKKKRTPSVTSTSSSSRRRTRIGEKGSKKKQNWVIDKVNVCVKSNVIRFSRNMFNKDDLVMSTAKQSRIQHTSTTTSVYLIFCVSSEEHCVGSGSSWW